MNTEEQGEKLLQSVENRSYIASQTKDDQGDEAEFHAHTRFLSVSSKKGVTKGGLRLSLSLVLLMTRNDNG